MITNPIKLLLFDEDKDFCFFITQLLRTEKNIEFAGIAHDRNTAFQMAEKLKPDIVMMDFIRKSGDSMEGIEQAREIRLISKARIIFLTEKDDPQIVIEACKGAFASGYILKSQYEFIPMTIKETITGCKPQEELIRALILSDLTAAERTVLDMILGRDIRLLSSEKTIANQKTNIFRKLGVRHTNELILLLSSL